MFSGVRSGEASVLDFLVGGSEEGSFGSFLFGLGSVVR